MLKSPIFSILLPVLALVGEAVPRSEAAAPRLTPAVFVGGVASRADVLLDGGQLAIEVTEVEPGGRFEGNLFVESADGGAGLEVPVEGRAKAGAIHATAVLNDPDFLVQVVLKGRLGAGGLSIAGTYVVRVEEEDLDFRDHGEFSITSREFEEGKRKVQSLTVDPVFFDGLLYGGAASSATSAGRDGEAAGVNLLDVTGQGRASAVGVLAIDADADLPIAMFGKIDEAGVMRLRGFADNADRTVTATFTLRLGAGRRSLFGTYDQTIRIGRRKIRDQGRVVLILAEEQV